MYFTLPAHEPSFLFILILPLTVCWLEVEISIVSVRKYKKKFSAQKEIIGE